MKDATTKKEGINKNVFVLSLYDNKSVKDSQDALEKNLKK